MTSGQWAAVQRPDIGFTSATDQFSNVLPTSARRLKVDWDAHVSYRRTNVLLNDKAMYTTWYNAKLVVKMSIRNITAIMTISVTCCSNKRNTMFKTVHLTKYQSKLLYTYKMHIITTITAKFAMYLATWAAQDVWKPVTTTRTMLDN